MTDIISLKKCDPLKKNTRPHTFTFAETHSYHKSCPLTEGIVVHTNCFLENANLTLQKRKLDTEMKISEKGKS